MRQFLLTVAVAVGVTGNAAFSQEGCDFNAPVDSRIQACSEVIGTTSSDPERLVSALVTRAFSYQEQNDRHAAIKDIDRAVAIRPDDPTIRELRGQLMFGFEDYAAAIRDFDWVIARYPEAYGSFVSRCLAKSETGDQWGALDDCERALRIEPNLPAAYNNMAMALYRAGASQAAVTDIDLALTAYPDFWGFIDTRAHILLVLDRPEEALSEFVRAAENGVQAVNLYQAALQKKGYFKGALDGQMSEALKVALADCVKDGCNLLAEAGTLANAKGADDQGVRALLVDPDLQCLSKAGFGEDSIFLSGGAIKTLITAEGAVIHVIPASGGLPHVLVRDENGWFAPALSDKARGAIRECNE